MDKRHRHIFGPTAIVVGLALLVAACATATSSTGVASVSLSGAQEVPPVNTSATGRGTITITGSKAVSGRIQTSGINGTAAHIHMGGPDENGPVIVTLQKAGDGLWVVPPGADVSDAAYDAFNMGKLYVNVHSDANKAGEIRGQIRP